NHGNTIKNLSCSKITQSADNFMLRFVSMRDKVKVFDTDTQKQVAITIEIKRLSRVGKSP
ncbi:MAG: hypothetical protein II453_11470, partial [Alphaproteobacteria bacterium]|nr:hypothetical protein [Alphaproteobacteria bacterium]